MNKCNPKSDSLEKIYRKMKIFIIATEMNNLL